MSEAYTPKLTNMTTQTKLNEDINRYANKVAKNQSDQTYTKSYKIYWNLRVDEIVLPL